jgi:hypothetical protein
MYSRTVLLLRALIVLNRLVSANGSGQYSMGDEPQASLFAAAAFRRLVVIVEMILYTTKAKAVHAR